LFVVVCCLLFIGCYFGYSPKRLLRAATDFKRHTERIGLNSGIEPRANNNLRVRRFRAELLVSVSKSASDSVDADQIAGVKKVHTQEIASALRLQTPVAIIVAGKKVRRSIGILTGAVRGETSQVAIT
jgi:tetrahydromethanopterin S-methyltransferase subunit G